MLVPLTGPLQYDRQAVGHRLANSAYAYLQVLGDAIAAAKSRNDDAPAD
jgi:hypothetical protein